MFSKWDSKVSSAEGGVGNLHTPQWAEETGWCGPTEVQGSEHWVASNLKALSKIVQSVFHPTYGLLILTHHTILMAYCVKTCAGCSQPPLCLEISSMSHRQIQMLERNHLKCMSSRRTKTKVWSFHKTKAKSYSSKQTNLNMSYFSCASYLVGGEPCHRMPNPMFVLAGRVSALCLVHKDAQEFDLLQILHKNKKSVHCSTLCPPFFRTEINKREAKVYSSGALQELCPALKEVVHDTCSDSVYHCTSPFQFQFSVWTQ